MAKRTPIKRPLLSTLISTACTLLLCVITTADAANISAFGDSITRGYGSDTGGYPAKLSYQLNNVGKTSTISNFGRDGENTYSGLGRFDEVLAAFPANFILILEGTNDISVGLSAEATKYNLTAMVNKAKAANVTPLISTLTPSTKAGSLTEVINPMIKEIASSNSIKLVDNYAATLPTWNEISGDGIHPNDNGYQIIADTWFAALNPMISSTGEQLSEASEASEASEGGGGGCFIATAAFGSPAEKHVILLKQFRDTCLLSNSFGRQFVKAYYHYSPPAADFISRHDNVKLAVRVLLYPLITLCYVLLKLSLPIQLALAALITAASCLSLSALVVRCRRTV